MPKKSLGQHFLYDPSIIERIVKRARISPEDLVIEIGPGPGIMTEVISEKAGQLIAVEIDKKLAESLKKRFAGRKNITIINEDFLKFPLPGDRKFKAIGNIPYYITTPIIFKLIETETLLSATLTIQKEVARRIVASPGSKDYGVLSIMVQFLTIPELAFNIPARAFYPPPKVDSSVIHLTKRSEPPFKLHDERLFIGVVKMAFSQRRKMLSNSLKPFSSNIKELLLSAGIDPKRRPETLTMEEFGIIADKFYDFLNK